MCCGVNLHKLQFTSLCCGNQTYNAREKQCFQNMIIIGLWESKCGDDNYDTREHICCKKTLIHKNSSSLRCCGSSSFDPSINECVGNRIIQKGYQWCQHRMCNINNIFHFNLKWYLTFRQLSDSNQIMLYIKG